MKKIILSIILLIAVNSFAQQDAWVYFSDKPNAETYLSNPLLMLSQRSLERRTTQNIPLDIKDVPISQAYIGQLAASEGITVMASSKWLNAVHVRGTVEAISALPLLSFVSQIDFADKTLNAGASGRMAQTGEVNPVNKNLDVQTVFAYGTSANQITMLKGNLLHEQGFTGSGKIIAVLDAGFPGVDTAQPFQRLWSNGQLLGGHNYVSGNDDLFTANNHGTMVLSTMGGYTEGQLVGTAPDASYYLFITENAASENPVEESYWVQAAEAADSLGVDVINTSLGYFGYDNPNYSYTYADMNGTTSFISRGADIAFSRGMVVVVSAGNSGAGPNPYIGVPADAVNVLTVGAVNSEEEYASFSSIGPSSDGRIKPDVMAQGVGAMVSNPSGEIMAANGTSFSGPITAGLVASLWQALPNMTNSEIVAYIKESANLYSNPNEQFGYGVPDFSLALAGGLAVQAFDANLFVAYPNPVNDRLSFVLPKGAGNGEVVLSTVLGQVVLQQHIDSDFPSVIVSPLNSGIYLYKIQCGSFIKAGKIIKK